MGTNAKRKQGRPHLAHQLNLEAVIETAAVVFAEKGYEGAQLSDIARRADINKSLVNYHFGNKDALWRRVVQHLADKVTDRFREAQRLLKDVEGIQLMRAFTRQIVYAAAEYPEFYKIVFHEMCDPSERTDWMIETVLKPLHQYAVGLKTIVEDEQALVMTVPLPNFVTILIGATNIFFVNQIQMKKQYGVDPFDLAQIEAHADIVVELLFPKAA